MSFTAWLLMLPALWPVAPHGSETPPRLAAFLDAATHAQRLHAVRALPNDLSFREQTFLRDFVATPNGRSGEAGLKNEVLNLLRRQQTAPPELAWTLISVFRDQEQSEVLRDYALQHLIAWYPHDRETVRQALVSALGETGSSIAGTALLGLHRLAHADTPITSELAASAALALVHDPDAGELALIAALRVCGAQGAAAALPLTRRLVFIGATDSIRMAAIATLGDLGGREDEQILAAIAAGEETRLVPAAQRALQQLRDRLASRGNQW